MRIGGFSSPHCGISHYGLECVFRSDNGPDIS
jgi:hypothetical protein